MEATYERRRERDYQLGREYHARRKRQTPPWACQKAIRAIYEEARLRSALDEMAYDVDHVFPLRSSWVSGLHVAENLAIVPASENRRKGNRRVAPPPRPRRPRAYDE